MKNKFLLLKIVASAVCLILGTVLGGKTGIVLFYISFAVVAVSPVYMALCDILDGEFFGEETLMCIASVCAMILKDYAEASAILLFFAIGELFEDTAVEKTREKIKALADLKPEYANKILNETVIKCSPFDLEIGDMLIIYPGEKIPVDATVLSGESHIDTKSLTGESLPKFAKENDKILGGTINLSGVLTVKVLSKYEESAAAKILKLIENAPENRSKTERFTARFAKYYTPIVLLLALLTALLPSLISGEWEIWIRRALQLLVISCPCALVISVPLAFFCGLGNASKNGILIKGSSHLETLAHTRTFAFDKTGTLTSGEFSLKSTNGDEMLLPITASVEKFSPHPLAKAICRDNTQVLPVKNFKNLPGLGVYGKIDGKEVYSGNEKLMKSLGITPEKSESETVIHTAYDGSYLGFILLEDTVKPNAEATVLKLKNLGCNTVLLSGDNSEVCKNTAMQVGIDSAYGDLLPLDKVNILKEYQEDGAVAFTGDGINDAPTMLTADTAFAMGAVGSDAATQSADIILLDDDLEKIPLSLKISKRTLRITKENICLSILIKIFVMILALSGITNLWFAVIADVGALIVAVLNSVRLLK